MIKKKFIEKKFKCQFPLGIIHRNIYFHIRCLIFRSFHLYVSIFLDDIVKYDKLFLIDNSVKCHTLFSSSFYCGKFQMYRKRTRKDHEHAYVFHLDFHKHFATNAFSFSLLFFLKYLRINCRHF